jgi:hypothetical protein
MLNNNKLWDLMKDYGNLLGIRGLPCNNLKRLVACPMGLSSGWGTIQS